MGNPDTERRRGAQRKLRAQARRDSVMADFCDRMVKESRRSDDPAARRDAGYWAEMAAYFRSTAQWAPPVRRVVPNTRRLEFLRRAADQVAAVTDREVLQLRAEGVSWQSIGEVFGLSRQGAVKRWAARIDGPAAELADLMDEASAADQIRELELAAAAEELRERLGVAGDD